MISGVLRSINTAIWDDPYIRNLSIKEKLIWMYMLSNRLTTMAGIYEITIDKIGFDTNVKFDFIKSTFKKFEQDKKIYYYENYLVMRNHLKNHHMNTNMEKGAMKVINDLPDNVKIFLFDSVKKVPKTFDKLRRIMLNKEIIIDDNEPDKPPEETPEDKYIKFDFNGSDDEPIVKVKFTEKEWLRFTNKFSTKFAIRCVRKLELWYGTKNTNHYGNDSKKIYTWVIERVREDIEYEKKHNKKVQL